MFFTSPDDPILTEPPCEGISTWMRTAPGPEKAKQGAELFDRLLAGPGVDRRYAQVRRTVWGLTHLSHIVTAYLEAGKPLTPEEIRLAAERIFHVEPVVPIHGQAGTGGSADAPRYGVAFHLHWPFHYLIVPHDGGDPVMQFYPWGEIPLPARTADERLDTKKRWVREYRAHLVWIMQRHPDVESIQRACFDGDHGLWINGTRHVLTLWDAFQPVRPAAGNPLVPTVGRSLAAQQFEDLFSGGADYEIAKELALAFDEARSPDPLNYVRRYFRKRRSDEARRQRSESNALGMLKSIGRDRRQIPSGGMDDHAANELLRRWAPERYRKDSENSGAAPEQTPGAELRPSSSTNGKPGRASDVPELNDLWVDRAGDMEGWTPQSATHRQAGRPVDSTWATETDRLHWERCRDEYQATLPPIKQTILDQLIDDPEMTWRDMAAVLARVHPGPTINDRTLRAWMSEIRQGIATLGQTE